MVGINVESWLGWYWRHPLTMRMCLYAGDETEQWMAVFAQVDMVVELLILAVLQAMGRADSPLRFYENTTRNAPVGFPADNNHMGTLPFMVMPFASGAIHPNGPDRKSGKPREPAVAFAVIAPALSAALILTRTTARVALLVAARAEGAK